MSKPLGEKDLAESLAHTLVPMPPPDAFREHLRTGLHLAGQQQTARRRYVRRSSVWQSWWLFMVAFGASIAAGSVLAYLIRSKYSSRAL